MPQYKLTYFDLTGLGEPIRLLFNYGGISFQDVRVPKDQWPELKPKTPLGQLPILEIDGRVLYQSTSIARYVSALVGLTGKSPLENWEIDATVDTINDLRTKALTWYFEANESTKAALKISLDGETIPFLLPKLESWAAKNKGYLAVGRLTWADVYFTGSIDFINEIYGSNLIQNYPNLSKVRSNVVAIPKIKAYIAKR